MGVCNARASCYRAPSASNGPTRRAPARVRNPSREGAIMSHPVIVADECIGCGICVDACPQEVLEVVGGVADVVNEDACIACGDCLEECPMGAIPEIVED
nr:4Fe-4S dicluster domain-containing protein [Adlercreutzia murintestinalis]